MTVYRLMTVAVLSVLSLTAAFLGAWALDGATPAAHARPQQPKPQITTFTQHLLWQTGIDAGVVSSQSSLWYTPGGVVVWNDRAATMTRVRIGVVHCWVDRPNGKLWPISTDLATADVVSIAPGDVGHVITAELDTQALYDALYSVGKTEGVALIGIARAEWSDGTVQVATNLMTYGANPSRAARAADIPRTRLEAIETMLRNDYPSPPAGGGLPNQCCAPYVCVDGPSFWTVGENGQLTQTECYLTEPCAPLGCVTRSVPANQLTAVTQCGVRNDCGGYGPSYGPVS
jgi:hypothetical protein